MKSANFSANFDFFPAKSADFSANLPLKIPRNLAFFVREISEALCIGPYGGLLKVVRIVFFIQYFLSDGPLFSYNVFLLFKLLLNPAQHYNTNVT